MVTWTLVHCWSSKTLFASPCTVCQCVLWVSDLSVQTLPCKLILPDCCNWIWFWLWLGVGRKVGVRWGVERKSLSSQILCKVRWGMQHMTNSVKWWKYGQGERKIWNYTQWLVRECQTSSDLEATWFQLFVCLFVCILGML